MMRRFTTAVMIALLAAPVMVSAQEKKPEGMAPDMEKMMAEYAKYSTPGAEHKQMAKRVGKWNYTSKMMMDPAQPPMETKGTAETTPLLGGRFFRTDYKGDFMGQTFEGIAIEGYDLYKKQYVSTWIDNMGTMMLMTTGTSNADGSEITHRFEFEDPATKSMKKVREVFKLTGPDSFVLEWYEMSPEGSEMKTMEISHTRAK